MAVEAEKAELPTSTLGGVDSGGGGAPGVLDSPRKPDAPPGPPVPPPAAAPEKKQQMTSPATTATANHQMANKKVGNDSSSNSKTSEMLGPIEMLQNPRLRLYIATALGGIPFLISGLLFVSSLSMVLQFIVGAIFGLLLMFSYQLIVLYRTHFRKVKVSPSQVLLPSIAELHKVNCLFFPKLFQIFSSSSIRSFLQILFLEVWKLCNAHWVADDADALLQSLLASSCFKNPVEMGYLFSYSSGLG
jgi:hypothetical protein